MLRENYCTVILGSLLRGTLENRSLGAGSAGRRGKGLWKLYTPTNRKAVEHLLEVLKRPMGIIPSSVRMQFQPCRRIEYWMRQLPNYEKQLPAPRQHERPQNEICRWCAVVN